MSFGAITIQIVAIKSNLGNLWILHTVAREKLDCMKADETAAKISNFFAPPREQKNFPSRFICLILSKQRQYAIDLIFHPFAFKREGFHCSG